MSRKFKFEWKSERGAKPFAVCKTLHMILGVLNVILGIFLVKALCNRRRGK